MTNNVLLCGQSCDAIPVQVFVTCVSGRRTPLCAILRPLRLSYRGNALAYLLAIGPERPLSMKGAGSSKPVERISDLQLLSFFNILLEEEVAR